MEQLLERFLGYVKIDTQSDTDTGLTPSTPGQMQFAHALVEELKEIGLSDVEVDENGYVMAMLPATVDYDVPVIGFIAHMDTSPDFSGKHVKPRVINNYQGGDIELNAQEKIILTTADFPEVENYKGQDLVVTDGTTLLGADDKAGVAEIVTAMEYLIKHPEVKHGKIRICFTPDEEIGAGADHFNVEKFGAEFAYTLDGSEIGELEYENFNAAYAKVTVNGRMVHPGYAKHKMRNSIRIANQIMNMLPRHETPEHTDGYEGFYHLMSFNGDVEKTEMMYIIRDFKRDRFEDRKTEMEHLIRKINSEYGEGTAVIEMKDQYYNMREKVEPVMHIVDVAKKAMEDLGIKPIVKPIRGGTDGARLSYMNLPTPNIFAGGHNFHGRFEFVPVQSMIKAAEVIVRISELVAKK
ncbi:peptidase T [Carboxylicivirga sp. N1Y90]|uniref:peptidase T n=1 Tax=Carboxylicivirga fragile TaxID=3417571 RepID=UPI003D3467D5|nr:peptidase T [Marinilabiliaceae bacterium N1Y90]